MISSGFALFETLSDFEAMSKIQILSERFQTISSFYDALSDVKALSMDFGIILVNFEAFPKH